MCNHSKLLWDVSHTWLETQQQNHWHQAEKWRRKSISLQKGSSLSILTQTTTKNHTFLLAASRICNYHSLKLWLEIFITKGVSPTKCDICCHNIVPPTADRSIMCPMEKLCKSNPTKESIASESWLNQSSQWFTWKQRGRVRLRLVLELFNKVMLGASVCNKDPVDTGIQLRREFND